MAMSITTALHEAARTNDVVAARRHSRRHRHQRPRPRRLHRSTAPPPSTPSTSPSSSSKPAPSIDATDNDGNTPLCAAAFDATSHGMITLLRGRGADPYHRNRDGKTAAEIARATASGEVVQFFANLPMPEQLTRSDRRPPTDDRRRTRSVPMPRRLHVGVERARRRRLGRHLQLPQRPHRQRPRAHHRIARRRTVPNLFDRMAGSGWHHSAWLRRNIIHSGDDKVHFDTRFAATVKTAA